MIESVEKLNLTADDMKNIDTLIVVSVKGGTLDEYQEIEKLAK